MNLAYRLRPQSLEQYVGQHDLVSEGKPLLSLLRSGSLPSMIFWGPPGSGKTTLAFIIAREMDAEFYELSGVTSGKEDLKKVIVKATENKEAEKQTVLFIDEIHRWNKAQQDALLPYVESGLLTLIGATTENPSFEIIGALLSRCRVFTLSALSSEDLSSLIDRALADETSGLGSYHRALDESARKTLIMLSGGDARIMLNALELAVLSYPDGDITQHEIEEIFQKKSRGLYDKAGEEHYNIISAYIKSMRGSDPDAALYYLARMLEGGEDPKFIARRMLIFASEDVGLADRGALIQANAAFDAVHKLGMPESQLTLAHITIYLAKAPKSRTVANALGRANAAVQENPNEPVPLHLRNAPTKLMKELGYAKEYTWGDDYVGPKKDLSFLPDKLRGKKFIE